MGSVFSGRSSTHEDMAASLLDYNKESWWDWMIKPYKKWQGKREMEEIKRKLIAWEVIPGRDINARDKALALPVK